MRTLLLSAVLVLIGLSSPEHLRAQAPVDSTRGAVKSAGWTAQEISDACRHKRGARMRLYGCPRDAYLPSHEEPLFIIDGQALPTDTVGPRRLEREATLNALRVDDIEDVSAIRPDSAVARFGSEARFGAVLIRTKHPAARPAPVPAAPVVQHPLQPTDE